MPPWAVVGVVRNPAVATCRDRHSTRHKATSMLQHGWSRNSPLSTSSSTACETYCLSCSILNCEGFVDRHFKTLLPIVSAATLSGEISFDLHLAPCQILQAAVLECGGECRECLDWNPCQQSRPYRPFR